MSLRQKAVKGVVWSSIQQLGGQVISFLVFFWLARLLQPEHFGLIALASVYLSFIDVFIDQGFSQAIVQRQELEPEHLNTAFWTSLGMSTILTAFSLIAADPIAQAFQEPSLAPIIRWLSLSFIFSALNSVQRALFSRKFAFKELAARSLIASTSGGIVGIIMAFLGCNVWSLVGQQLVNGLIGVLILWSASDWSPGLKVSKKHFRDLFSFSAHILGFNVLNFFNRRSDDFLVGYFLGSVELGYYTVAYRLLLTVTRLMRTMSSVSLPTFSRLQSEPERLQRGFYTATQLTSLIAFPVFIGQTTLATEIITGLFGPQWTPSIPVMQILSFIGIVHSLNGITVSVINSMGKPGWTLKVNILNSFANVTAFVLVVKWGIVAIAAAYVVRGYVLALPIFLTMSCQLIGAKITTYLRYCATPLLGSVIMSGAILLLKPVLKPWVSIQVLLLIGIIWGAIIYLATIYIFARQLIQQVIDLVKIGIGGKSKKMSS